MSFFTHERTEAQIDAPSKWVPNEGEWGLAGIFHTCSARGNGMQLRRRAAVATRRTITNLIHQGD
jgi:hypothetical protein